MELARISRRLPLYETETVSMGQYNVSDNIKPGDIADSYGISARRWPAISTRWGRRETYPPSATTAIFAWDGHRVRVTGGILYYDDKELSNVSSGPKQFAVVNTKLIVWPDKKYIDVTNGTFGDLNAQGEAQNAVLTDTKLTADLTGVESRNEEGSHYVQSAGFKYNAGFYTYGKDPSKISWDEKTGWALPKATLSGFWGGGTAEAGIVKGDIFIPKKTNNSFNYVAEFFIDGALPDISEYNNEGYYGVVTKLYSVASIYPNETLAYCNFDVYKKGYNKKLFSDTLLVGDAVNVTGTIGGYNDVEKAIITGMNDSPNSLTFGEGTFKVPAAYAELTEGKAPAVYRLKAGGTYYTFDATAPMPKGAFLFVKDNVMTVWDKNKKKVINTYTSATPGDTGGTEIPGTAYNGEEKNLVIARAIPDMDFICEKDNRLWGCSNKERTIFASALGDPTRWYEYKGTSTDSVAIPVGSEGLFTACCKYNNAVLFFKENQILRVLGDFPPQYSLYTDVADGVMAGSHKSLQIISGILFYLGTHGVYSYTGGTPVLISYNFGEKVFTDGISGNDGDTYYLAVKEGEKKHLLVYETKQHIWVHEDNLYALDFARLGRDLRMLLEDGSIKSVSTQEDDFEAKWLVQFCPMYETIKGRKSHGRLTIRMELPKRSWMRVYVRHDGGAWEDVGSRFGSEHDTVTFPLPAARSDKFEIKLEGKGPAAILEMSRRFRIGSDK